MAVRFKNLDRNTPMLMPPDLRDWVKPNHIVHFIIDEVDRLPSEGFQFNHRGTGDAQYPPRMMLALLIYCYATGRFSSREIEEAMHSDVVTKIQADASKHSAVSCKHAGEQVELLRREVEQLTAKAETEWCLVRLSYNLKKMFNLSGKCAPKRLFRTARQHAKALLARFRAYFAPISCTTSSMLNILSETTKKYCLGGILTPTGC